MVRSQARAREEMLALRGELTAMGETLSDATVSTEELVEAQKLLQKASEFSIVGVKAVDNATLKNLQNQIDKASEKIKALSDTARQTVLDLESELASIQGNEQEVLRIKHAQKLADLEAKMAEAKAQNNSDAIAHYQKALDLQQQINTAESQKLSQSLSATAESQKLQSPSAPLNLPGTQSQVSTGNLSANDVIKAWEQNLAQFKQDAKAEAKQELIKELVDGAKGRAR